MKVLFYPGWVLQKSRVKSFDKLKIERTAELQTYPKNFDGNFLLNAWVSFRVLPPPFPLNWVLGKTLATYLINSKSKKLQYFEHTQKISEGFFYESNSSAESSVPPQMSSSKKPSKIFWLTQNRRNCRALNIFKKFQMEFFVECKSSVESSSPPRMSSKNNSTNIFRWTQNPRNYSTLNIPKKFRRDFFFQIQQFCSEFCSPRTRSTKKSSKIFW